MTRKRIFIVDDEPGFTRLMKLGLERVGDYDVLEENEASMAACVARKFRPDIIFLDLIMPRIRGDEIAAQIRADPELAGVPIIFLTALVSESLCRVHESCPILPKPIGLAAITGCISQYCSGDGHALRGNLNGN
jgi:CheY-like chemotaxis protein